MGEPTQAQLAEFLKNPPFAKPVPIEGAAAMVNLSAFSGGIPEELLAAASRVPTGLTILKFGSRAIVGSYDVSEEPIVLKYYEPASFVKHLTYGLRGSRCHRSWIAGLALGFIGVPTPAPLMIAEWSSLGGLWHSRSFLATRQAPGVSLAKFAAGLDADDPLLQKTAASLREAFTILARFRAVHGDLKENNIIVSPEGTISFIDLDGASFLLPQNIWREQREKDRLRFIKNWNAFPHLAAAFHQVFDPS